MEELKDLSGPFNPDLTFDCFSKELLLRLVTVWQHAWLQLSECWYKEVLKSCGREVADKCEIGAWCNMAEKVNPRYAKVGNIQLSTVVDSMKVIQLPLDNTIGGLYPVQCEVKNENHVIWTIPRCKSLEYFEAKEPERIKQVCYENEKKVIERYMVNRRIRVSPLKLPPRNSREEIACKWEAVMMDKDQWGPYDQSVSNV
ncbi:MAG: hypothetical protein NTU41_05475 [Chloroflexi bacterium]|nr:hypothetical protein [Chloroflexota bacterium]